MPTDYDIGAAFSAIENELISSMMRNLKHHRAEETKGGFQWSQWQAEQLDALEAYKRQNQQKYQSQFQSINEQLERAIQAANQAGGMEQETAILRAIQNGAKIWKQGDSLAGSFFQLNEQKLDALIRATTSDMEQAETAVLRRANDQYRKIIYNAQVYANTGAGTYEKAVDMATKDFLSAGIQCVVYKNGARHTLSDYADMALRTASKRAYLQGEGAKRQEWGITTVIINKRSGACPDCARFCGKVFIDDVWSGGKRSDGDYPLLSKAIEQGLYHPRCKDSHSTYFPELYEDEKPYTEAEIAELEGQERQDQRQQYAQRQVEKFRRLEKFSLDEENQRKYGAKSQEWERESRIAAEETAASLGVKADYSAFNPDLAQAVNQSISEAQDFFGELTELNSVREYRGDANFYAAFSPKSGTIFLKDVGRADIIAEMRQIAERQFVLGGWSTGSVNHAIAHEIGHAIEKQYLTSEKEAALEMLRVAEVARVTGRGDTDILLAVQNSDSRLKEWGNKAKENLSLYGISSVNDLIAESVAQNILGEPGELAKQVIMILLEE